MQRFLIFITLAVVVRCQIVVKPLQNATLATYVVNETVVSTDPAVYYPKQMVNESVTVFVSCQATYSGGPASVTWYREGTKLTMKDFGRNNVIMKVETAANATGAESTLYVFKPKREHAASYMCEFAIGLVKMNSSVYIHSPPLISNFEKAKRAIQGDKLKISCDVAGYPKPDRVVWYFQNRTSDWIPRDGVTYDTVNGVENAKLLFSNLEFEDRGVYWCSATNIYGEDNSGVLVRAKNRLDALWPFLGIVAEVVILVTAILIYEKKRSSVKKPAEVNGAAGGVGDTRKEEEEEAETAPDAKDGDKDDVRQRTVKA